MRQTKFILKSEVEKGQILMYNTFTTSLTLLEKRIYEEIFIEKNYSRIEIVNELKEMGFFIEDDFDEDSNLTFIRKSAIDSAKHITTITVAPTMACNARCFYCFEKGAEPKTMNDKIIENTIEYIYNNSNKETIDVSWFGGEPLLRFDIIIKMIEELQNKGLEVRSMLTTNGLLFTDDIIHYISQKTFHYVQITVDEIGENFNQIRNFVTNHNNPFEIVMGNIQKLLDVGIKTHLRINFREKEFSRAKEIFAYLLDKFPGHDGTSLFVYMSPLVLEDNMNEMYYDCNSCVTHPFYELIKFQQENDHPVNREYYISKDSENRDLRDLMLFPIPASCGSLSDGHYSIDADGYLYKCHRFLGKKEYACGNVNVGYVETDIVKFFKKYELDDESCKVCNIMPLCHGGCKAIKYEKGLKKRCNPVKKAYPYLLKFLYNNLINENV